MSKRVFRPRYMERRQEREEREERGWVEIEGVLEAETQPGQTRADSPGAYLLDHGARQPTWLPKSVAHPADGTIPDIGVHGTYMVRRWFAEKHGLV